ncbi:DNA-binding CsgD family transcriptional regulator [Kitasatospora sp. MAP12-15]|uniref:helix-turn-helix transcriptional regulator n=1 Tax=unclassified Kitasatospora TaxID=2633591 RepID=UPI0024734BDE|nr:LuxR C-terminal-related transcriptional regulator [Kitasatospora sp. MAP12-44]MDH6109372.1 DNA-binding CsgD family transcriptional regulator [Kitasatospora sp. MAP12-44]
MREEINAGELALLRVLIDAREPLTNEVIADLLSVSGEQAAVLAAHLLAAGLAKEHGPAGALAAGSPDLLLTRLIETHQHHLVGQLRFEESLSAALEVLGARVASGRPGGDAPSHWRLLRGQQEITGALEEAVHRARREILSLHPGLPMSPAELAGCRLRQQGAVERGVALRSVHLTAMMRVPHGRPHLRGLVDSGIGVRIAPVLPFRLLVVDDALAYTSSADLNGEPTALELRGSELVLLLREMFAFCWRDAQPMESQQATAVERFLSERELTIVRMLSEGRTDIAIARSLGVSERTFRRLIVQVMEQLGAQSRFQAGVRAAELGLVPSPHPSVQALVS